MQINNKISQIQLKQTNTKSMPAKAQSLQPYSIGTSIYNQKGVYVPFCGIAKGIDAAEEACIKLLRKVRENRYRKFTEDDISEIVKHLRNTPNLEDKQQIIEEVFMITDAETGLKPSKQFIKDTFSLIKDSNESERYAILEFAQDELNTVRKPLESLKNYPAEKRESLIKILEDINCADNPLIFKSCEDTQEHVHNLYELFRTILYASEDIGKLTPQQAAEYKLDTIGMVYHDMKKYNNPELYNSAGAMEKVSSVTKKIFDKILETVLKT